MRWYLIAIILTIILTTTGIITLCESCYSTREVLSVPRNPFYDLSQSGISIGVPDAFVGVNITYPINGTTYYTSTQWLNTTIYGDGTPPYDCWYRTTGSWNTYNCENQSITFSNGEVEVTVMVEDSNGAIGYGYGLFYIYEKVGGGEVYEDMLSFFFVCSLLVCFMIFSDRKKKKRKD